CSRRSPSHLLSFSSNHTAPPQHHPLSLHDALPISWSQIRPGGSARSRTAWCSTGSRVCASAPTRCSTSTASSPCAPSSSNVSARSEEHTSELQSLTNLVCRLLLEKKKS